MTLPEFDIPGQSDSAPVIVNTGGDGIPWVPLNRLQAANAVLRSAPRAGACPGWSKLQRANSRDQEIE